MKKLSRVLFCVLAVGTCLAFAATKATVEDILKDPAKFDNKEIAVTAKVADFKAKTSKAGNKYFTFKLKSGEKEVNVYGRGELEKEPKEGDKVTATGIFRKEKQIKDFKVKNEIDVSKVDGKDFGVKAAK